jgi:hypothetical protein
LEERGKLLVDACSAGRRQKNMPTAPRTRAICILLHVMPVEILPEMLTVVRNVSKLPWVMHKKRLTFINQSDFNVFETIISKIT